MVTQGVTKAPKYIKMNQPIQGYFPWEGLHVVGSDTQ